MGTPSHSYGTSLAIWDHMGSMGDGKWMCHTVTNVHVKFNYDRLWIGKALGNFQKSDNNKNKNNVRSNWVNNTSIESTTLLLHLLQLNTIFLPARGTELYHKHYKMLSEYCGTTGSPSCACHPVYTNFCCIKIFHSMHLFTHMSSLPRFKIYKSLIDFQNF